MIGRRRPYGFAALAAALAAAIVALFGGSASQASPGRLYLALGDSVPFGYITQAGYEYVNADNFAGYPGDVGDALGMPTVNAACPGEATTGFLSATGADNGCRTYRGVYHFPLHVSYPGTQLDFATSYVRDHPNTRLVTLQLGADDVFLLEKSCNNDQLCILAGLPALLKTVSDNVSTILQDIRAAKFHGVLMVENYYSLDYSDPVGTGVTEGLNAAIDGAAQANGAVVADAFTAFQQAAQAAGGKTCNAGLLNASPTNQLTCDVHPSRSGQLLLAQTIEDAYNAADNG
jgi:hypothetical protein